MRKKSAAKGLTAQDKTKHSRESEPLIDAIKLVKCIWGKQTVWYSVFDLEGKKRGKHYV